MKGRASPAEQAAAGEAIRQFAADVQAVDRRRRRLAAMTDGFERWAKNGVEPGEAFTLPDLLPMTTHWRRASTADLTVAMNALERYVLCHNSALATGLLKLMAAKVGRAAPQRRVGPRIDPTWQQVDEFFAEWRDANDGKERGARAAAMRRFGCDERTIDARRKEAKEQ